MATSQEANFKKVLGLSDVVGMALGQIIGAGVLIFTGIGIGMTGKGIMLAFLVAAAMTAITILPMAQLSSAIPTTGAAYRYSSRLLGPKWGFYWMIGLMLSKVTIALYALSFAQYLQGLVPWINVKIVALVMMTTFYVTNIIGIKSAAVAEKWMVVIKISALAIFIIWGIPNVDFSSFTLPSLVPNGIDGLLQAIGLLAFAAVGANSIAELGGEMKNPARDIPLAMIGSTVAVGVIYSLVGVVAVGVLPWESVANKPLTDVARVILPAPLLYFFIIGGALVAMATTMNAVFAWVTKGMVIACQDGWLPKSLGTVNKKFGTPHRLLTIFYAIGVTTIVAGIPMASVAKIGMGVLTAVNIIPVIAAYFLPTQYPEQLAKAKFSMKPHVLRVVVVLSVVIMAFQAFYSMKSLPNEILLFIAGVMAAGLIYVNIVGNNARFKTSDATSFYVDNEQDMSK